MSGMLYGRDLTGCMSSSSVNSTLCVMSLFMNSAKTLGCLRNVDMNSVRLFSSRCDNSGYVALLLAVAQAEAIAVFCSKSLRRIHGGGVNVCDMCCVVFVFCSVHRRLLLNRRALERKHIVSSFLVKKSRPKMGVTTSATAKVCRKVVSPIWKLMCVVPN